MAEEKKEKSGGVGIMDTNDPYEVIVILLLALGLLGYLIERFLNFRHSDLSFLEWVKSYFIGILPFVIVISVTVSILFLIGIIRSNRQLKRLHHALQLKFHSTPAGHGASHEVPAERINQRWEKVQKFIMSPNMSDWKLAILEADVMLEEMVDKIGYPGESLGEKLKNVERSDFTTVELAWEAHKIRNSLAHEGSDFLLTHREALRVIGLFEKVFHEFRYI
ncbi:MAG: hypothetical protein AAB534_02670 [Patescibacteria group bacterium]